MKIEGISSSKIAGYYNYSTDILNSSKLTPSYKKWLKKEEEFLRKTIPKNSKILEIGAGTGRIIDALNNRKRQITGIDIANIPFLKKKYAKNK